MNHTSIIKDRDGNDFVIITNEDGSQTGMSKATYDEQQAHLTESVTPQAVAVSVFEN